MAIYLGIAYLLNLLFRFLSRIILFPVLRWLAHGTVMSSRTSNPNRPLKN